MKKQIGGYLNLNESFEQTFSDLTNLNEARKKSIKDFYTPEIAKLISYHKFRDLCNDGEFQMEGFEEEEQELGLSADWKILIDLLDELNPEYKGIVNKTVWDYLSQ